LGGVVAGGQSRLYPLDWMEPETGCDQFCTW